MEPVPEVDDLRLLRALGAAGSLGAAARRLQVSQPSASQRLARLERRVGVRLFERDTQGARPTAAGAELVRQAEHVLGHLERAFDAARDASATRALSVGTISSLVATVLPALVLRVDADVEQRVDHGDRLVEWLAEGTLDAAVIAIAQHLVLPRGLAVHAVGEDELVLLLPAGVALSGRGRQPWRDRRVVFATYDDGSEDLRRRVTGLGAEPVRAATVPTALAIGRLGGLPAVVPRSAVAERQRGERVRDLPWRHRLRLSMVTRRDADQRLLDALPGLRADLGLVAS
jgi:DNA-binding transcriptional LysR family regulator